MLAKEAWAQVFQPGTHGTTFGGNPLAATVANAVLAHLDAPLLAGVGERHALIVDQLNAISARYDAFSAVRGTGLLMALSWRGRCAARPKTLTNLAAEEGLIALIAGPDVLRFAPALNIPLADIAEAFVRLDRAVARFNPLTGRRPVMLFRPVRENDLDDIVRLAARAGGRHDLFTA